MAKSGMYYNGEELLECELGRLDRVDRLQVLLETNEHMQAEALRAVAHAPKPSPPDEDAASLHRS